MSNYLSSLVSVIVPCYNYGAYLEEALDSVLNQTYTNWECIVVNDGSTDSTEEIVRKFTATDPRFIYLFQENKGLAGARNTALRHAKGEYIQLLDADDLLQPEKLKLQVELFQEDGNFGLVYSSILLFHNRASKREFRPFTIQDQKMVSAEGEQLLQALIKDNFFVPGCVMFTKKLFEQTGFFKLNMPGLEDWNYWYRAALLGFPFYHDERPGTHLLARDHDSNMSKVHQKMLNARIYARLDVIASIVKIKAQQKIELTKSFKGEIDYSTPFMRQLMRKHKEFLVEDKTTFQLYYGNIVIGIKNMILHAYYSRKPHRALTNAAKWTYLRFKGFKV